MAMDLSRVPARIFSDSEMTLFRLEGLDIVLAAAGERQQLRGQLGGAAGALFDGVHRPEKRMVVVDVGFQPRGVAQDATQDVVEIVGDAAGQQADGFHFLRLDEPLLQQLALGDIAHVFDHPGQFAVPVEEREGMQFQPAPLAIVADQRHDVHLGSALAQRPNGRADAAGFLASVIGLVTLLAGQGQLVGVPSVHGLVDLQDVQVAVQDADPVLDAVENRRQESLALLQLALGLLAPQRVGDVLRDEDQQFAVALGIMKILLVALDHQDAERALAALQGHAQPFAGGGSDQFDRRLRRPSARPAGQKPAAAGPSVRTYSVNPRPSSLGWGVASNSSTK